MNKREVMDLVKKHRRHVEQSPGVGVHVQRYAIGVLDDVLADLERHRPGALKRILRSGVPPFSVRRSPDEDTE